MPRELKSTSNHPFVESFQPAESATTFQIDVLRMHDILDRRVPTQRYFVAFDSKNIHSSSRDDGDRQLSVIDTDQLDAFLGQDDARPWALV